MSINILIPHPNNSFFLGYTIWTQFLLDVQILQLKKLPKFNPGSFFNSRRFLMSL